MRMVQLTELSEPAIHEFVRTLLGWDDAFSIELRSLQLESARVFSYLPEGFHLRGRGSLDSSHGLDGRFLGLRTRYCRFIHDYLRTHESGLALFAGQGQISDPFVERIRTPYLQLPDAEGYLALFLDHGRQSIDLVQDALRDGRAFTMLIALTEYEDKMQRLHRGQLIRLDELSSLVSRSRYLLAECFDGFGYFIYDFRNALKGRRHT